jgi:hypothetical protein
MVEIIFSDWIQIILGIINTITFLVLLFSFLEMRNQRRSSYKPDLIPRSQNFRVKYFIDKQGYFEWETISIRNTNAKINDLLNFYLVNVGLGPAKYISVAFDLDFNGLIEEIKKLDEEKEFDIELNKNKGFVKISHKKRKSFMPNINIARNYSILHNKLDRGILISVPLPVMELYLIYIYLWGKYNADRSFNYKLPSAFTVRYKDMDNLEYNKTFDIFFEILMMDSANSDESSIISLNMRFKES